MNDNYFFDTNILVYAFSTTGEDKRETIAWKLVRQAMETGSGNISTQVLKEFYVAMTSGISEPIDPDEARCLLEELEVMRIVQIDTPLIYRAIDVQEQEPLSFWDALICSSAQRAGCDTVYSEDLNDGQEYGGVTIQNPFQNSGNVND